MSSRNEMKIRMQLKLKYTRVKTQNRVAQNYEKEQLEGSEEERERKRLEISAQCYQFTKFKMLYENVIFIFNFFLNINILN